MTFSIPDFYAFVISFTNFNQLSGIMLYWVPLSFCTIFYTVRTARNYIHDRNEREKIEKEGKGLYYPTDTIGAIIGRGLVSIIPVANIFASIFDLAPIVFGKFFKFLGKTFNQPLVPRRDKK